MINIDNKFDIGQTVYLVTDGDNLPRLVVGINISKHELLYRLACGTTTQDHYDFEISEEKNVLAG